MTIDTGPPVALAWATVPVGTPRRDVAWELVRNLAGREVGVANPCPRCGGPHGPVVLVGTDLRASVAYSGDVAVAAVAGPGVAALGIDAEPAARATTGLRLGRELTLRDWVRIEAVLKADGRGLAVDTASVEITVSDDGGMRASIAPKGTVYRVADLAGPDGHFVSVAFAPDLR